MVSLRMNIQSTSSKEKEIFQFILISINITPLLPYSHSYSPLCLAEGPISAAETRLVWNMLQCCRAAGRGVGGPRVCSQLVLRDAARQDPRPPTHPRTAHSRHTGTPRRQGRCLHTSPVCCCCCYCCWCCCLCCCREIKAAECCVV